MAVTDTNQKASEFGISLLQEQRKETRRRESESKKWDRRNAAINFGANLYENTILDAKAEEWALGNSPFKAKLQSMQGNAANILKTQSTIDSTGVGGFSGSAYNYWVDFYSRQLTNQWGGETGKLPPRATVSAQAKKLAKDRLKDWEELVNSARAVPSTAAELEQDWENYQKLNIPSNIGEQMGRGIRNAFRSKEKRTEAESLTKSDINSNPLFARYKNFADRYETYANFNPGMADAMHNLATKQEWKAILDPNVPPKFSSQTIKVRLNDGSVGSQVVNTVMARTIEGEWVTTEVRGAAGIQEAATGTELNQMYDDLNPDGDTALSNLLKTDPTLTINQLYALTMRPPYTKVDLLDEKNALEIEVIARKLYEREMFELAPDIYYRQNFTVNGYEFKRTKVPLAEGVQEFDAWYADKKLEWNNYKPKGISWDTTEVSTSGSRTGTSSDDPNSIQNIGTPIVLNDLSNENQELLQSNAILKQVVNAQGVVSITFGPNKIIPRGSLTGDPKDQTMVQVVYNADTEEFYTLPADKTISSIYTTEDKGWAEGLTRNDSVKLPDGSRLTWTGSNFEQSGTSLTREKFTFTDIPDSSVKEGIKTYALGLYTSFLDPEREIKILEQRLETGVIESDITTPGYRGREGKELYTGSQGSSRRKRDEERLAYLKDNPPSYKDRSAEELFSSIISSRGTDFSDIIDIVGLGDWKDVRQILIDAVNSELPDKNSRIAYLEKQGISVT
jgi:hypothetical protein